MGIVPATQQKRGTKGHHFSIAAFFFIFFKMCVFLVFFWCVPLFFSPSFTKFLALKGILISRQGPCRYSDFIATICLGARNKRKTFRCMWSLAPARVFIFCCYFVKAAINVGLRSLGGVSSIDT